MGTIISNGIAVTNLNPQSGGAGSDDYENLKNLPKIEGTTLIGDKSLSDIGADSATDEDIDALFE